MPADIIKLPARYDVRISYQRRGKRPKATVLELPRDHWYYYHRASAIDERDYHSAIKLYERALELNPGWALALTNLANCWFRLHCPDTAVELYEQALAADPDQPEAAYNLGYMHLERGFPMAAIPWFKRSLALDPSFADAWFNLAMAYEQVGKVATAEWNTYLRLNPTGKLADIARRHV